MLKIKKDSIKSYLNRLILILFFIAFGVIAIIIIYLSFFVVYVNVKVVIFFVVVVLLINY